jgi:hypothetical protein
MDTTTNHHHNLATQRSAAQRDVRDEYNANDLHAPSSSGRRVVGRHRPRHRHRPIGQVEPWLWL